VEVTLVPVQATSLPAGGVSSEAPAAPSEAPAAPSYAPAAPSEVPAGSPLPSEVPSGVINPGATGMVTSEVPAAGSPTSTPVQVTANSASLMSAKWMGSVLSLVLAGVFLL